MIIKMALTLRIYIYIYITHGDLLLYAYLTIGTMKLMPTPHDHHIHAAVRFTFYFLLRFVCIYGVICYLLRAPLSLTLLSPIFLFFFFSFSHHYTPYQNGPLHNCMSSRIHSMSQQLLHA